MEYPKFLMKDILWNFGNGQYFFQQEFVNALIRYNQDIKSDEVYIDTDSIILKSPKVVIQYSYWDEEKGDITEPSFLLNADNGKFFTQGELLYKVNNEVHQKLKEEDHKFFEGFSLWEGENPNYPDIPLYFLLQGS